MRMTTAKRKLHRSYSYQVRRAGTRAFPARMKRFKSERRLHAIMRDDRIRNNGRINRRASSVASHPAHTAKVKRKPGLLQGRIWIAPDFDDALELVPTVAREETHSATMGV